MLFYLVIYSFPLFFLKGMDDRRANPSEVFYIGQSVRTYIMDVGDFLRVNSLVTGRRSLGMSFCLAVFRLVVRLAE